MLNLGTSNSFSSKISKTKTTKPNIFFFITGSGCKSACLNGGYCNPSNGLCVCPNGFNGSTCATSTVLGCNAGGSISCLNGGYCNPSNGLCVCPNGYSGITCSIGT